MLEFRVLGPLEIGSHGTPVRVSGRKERAVLAALLVDPGRAGGAGEAGRKARDIATRRPAVLVLCKPDRPT